MPSGYEQLVAIPIRDKCCGAGRPAASEVRDLYAKTLSAGVVLCPSFDGNTHQVEGKVGVNRGIRTLGVRPRVWDFRLEIVPRR